jgi:hypothetical protein
MDKKTLLKKAVKKEVPSGLDDLKLKIKKVPATNVPIGTKFSKLDAMPKPVSQLNPIQQQEWFRKSIPLAYKKIKN